MNFDDTSDEPKHSANLMAAALDGNAIELVKTEHGFRLPEPSPEDRADVGRLKKLLNTYRESAAAIIDSGLLTPAYIAAAAKLRSAPGVESYIETLRWAAQTPVRRADLMPLDAMVQAVMFPLVHAAMLNFVHEGEFEMTIDEPAANLVVARRVADGLSRAGHVPSMSLVLANLDAVRNNFHALLFAEEGEPADFDPEPVPGGEIEKEIELLAEGDYLKF